MTTPVRLRHSRAKGFNLQKLSLETNGLPAVNVARPGKWGNPWKAGQFIGSNADGARYATAADCVELFSIFVLDSDDPLDVTELRGKNLACWCEEGPCHADILLELANR